MTRYRDKREPAPAPAPAEPTPREQVDAPPTSTIELTISTRQQPGQKPEFSATLYTPYDGRRVVDWLPLYRFNVELAMLARTQVEAYERMTRGTR